MRHFLFAATLAVALPFHDLPSQFEKIASAAQGRVGVATQLIESGETADLHGEEHFPMHSVYKLPISMAVLSKGWGQSSLLTFPKGAGHSPYVNSEDRPLSSLCQ